MNPDAYLLILQFVALGLVILGGAGWIIEELRSRALKRQLAELTQELEEAQRQLEYLRVKEARAQSDRGRREQIR